MAQARRPSIALSYDDAKEFEGRLYSGMSVGGRHRWDYTDGAWEEQKLAPDAWSFTFRSPKRRARAAPAGSGAPVGTMFHWFLLAHQRVRKVDENTYETFMEGSKWKLAHKRPAWRRWSSEYRPQPTARDKMIEVLEDALARLKLDRAARAPRLEALLDPGVYGEDVRLDDFVDPSEPELADAALE
jgi:hypothetical protein